MTGPGRVLVIGAGPCGLGAALRFAEKGVPVTILEATDEVGGLAGSVTDSRGFTWDFGVHVTFSHYDHYDAVLDRALPGGWELHERRSLAWLRSRFVPYPVQNNIHRFDAADRDAAFAGLVAAAAGRGGDGGAVREGETFRDWILGTCGRPLAELFMLPYNEKIWGHPLDEMGVSWMGERVAVPDVDRIRRTLESGQDDAAWGPNASFRFPREGGTGAVWRGVAELLPAGCIRHGARVVAIDPAARRLTLDGGEELAWDALISTMPLDVLARRCRGLSPDAVAAAESLARTSVHVIGFGLRGDQPEALRDLSWIYCPEPAAPYYRVTTFSNYAPGTVPPEEGCWSLLLEVCETAHRPVDGNTVVASALDALRRDGFVGPGTEVLSTWHRRLSHGYPVPTLHRDAALAVAQGALEAAGVYSRGRFGGWKYEASNQDHSFMQGVEVADRLLDGTPETTYPHPSRANSGIFRRPRS